MRTVLVVAALIALPGCDPASSSVPDLGDPYTVERMPEPLLDGDTLRVTVSYSGGCADHDFELGYAVGGASPALWLEHDANGDLCEAYITRQLEIPVPAAAVQGRPVRLYVTDTDTIELAESLQSGAPMR